MENTLSGLFGLFELDTEGVVLYSKIDMRHSSVVVPTDLIGQNFFDEISEYVNIERLRRHFVNFAKARDSVENLTFIYSSEPESVKAGVMLTKIYQRESGQAEKLIVSDIRKAL